MTTYWVAVTKGPDDELVCHYGPFPTSEKAFETLMFHQKIDPDSHFHYTVTDTRRDTMTTREAPK